jgi:FAD/FMN-containing dehydrogenase
MQEGLYAIVGSDGRGALEANYRLDDAAPFAVVAPASESEVCALMEYTYAMRTPCLVAGSGTYLTHLTPPDRAWWLLSTRRLNRVIDYSPQDLVLTVGAGTTLHAVQELLREHRQYLPWNPALPAQATIGGIVSSNRAGCVALSVRHAARPIAGNPRRDARRCRLQKRREGGQKRRGLRPPPPAVRRVGHAGGASPKSRSRCSRCPSSLKRSAGRPLGTRWSRRSPT